MKLIMSLLLIILITMFSWSSCAKNTKVQVNAIYYQSSSATHSLILTPILSRQYFSHQYSNEDFAVTGNRSTNKTNNFFEFAIIFNEKLQQFIAFFADLGDEIKVLTHHDFSSDTSLLNKASSLKINQIANQKCTTSN